MNFFDYDTNTTRCDDGTFCPNPNNQTCCFNHQGRKEITYHNTATIPSKAAGWSTYYEAAGYTIPNPSSRTSTSATTSARSNLVSLITSTVTSTGSLAAESTSTQPLRTAASEASTVSTPSTPLSAGAKAGIAVAGGVCALVIGTLLYLLRRPRKKRLTQPSLKTGQNALRYDKPELPGQDTRTEMGAGLTQDGRFGGRQELMGQERSELR